MFQTHYSIYITKHVSGHSILIGLTWFSVDFVMNCTDWFADPLAAVCSLDTEFQVHEMVTHPILLKR